MKIKFTQGDIEIMGFGKTEAGKTVDVPDELGKSLIESDIAIEVKKGKIKTGEKPSEVK
jgi:hypothetical protein|tara:strand:- start:384 stop:560 length:177 start_codon:yes stop_codon:yes gene_type:complete